MNDWWLNLVESENDYCLPSIHLLFYSMCNSSIELLTENPGIKINPRNTNKGLDQISFHLKPSDTNHL